jgi:uncharacterized protein (TIGR02996 family)
MSDRESLLAAIIASPAEDLPRLVFADWLDDQGDVERAEFIREQVADPMGKWIVTQPWQDEIPNGHAIYNYGGFTWPASLGGIVQRGFLRGLRGPLNKLLEHGPAICREHPVESVEVTDKKPMELDAKTWVWQSEIFADRTAPQIIPSDLHNAMIGPEWMGVIYRTEQAGIESLNAAVLANIKATGACKSDSARQGTSTS